MTDNKYDSSWQGGFSKKNLPTPANSAEPEAVNHPAHYTAHPSGVEAITITSGFCFALGNVIKYVWRAGLKSSDPLPDLRKALWYLQYHIKALEDAQDGRRGRGSGGGPGGGTGD